MIEHKHIIIRAEVEWFYAKDQKEDLENWVKGIIKKLGMNLLAGPVSAYVDRKGLKGWTCLAAIETSHIAIHVWDEDTPVVVQFDIYTCGALDKEVVFNSLKAFRPTKKNYRILDREYDIKTIEDGADAVGT